MGEPKVFHSPAINRSSSFFSQQPGEIMEALQTKPLEVQNPVGATDIISPTTDSSTANSSVGSSIQESELGKSLTAALEAPIASTPSEPQVSASQESQALNLEQAPSQAPAPTANIPVGDSADPTDPPNTNSLRLTSSEPVAEALADVVPGLDPSTITPPPADPAVQGFSTDPSQESKLDDDHDHGNPGTAPLFHISLDDVTSAKGVNSGAVRTVKDMVKRFGTKGDLLDPGEGNNTVIGAGGNDLILATGGGLNTITTGGGSDTIVLGDETTNRIFDFNPDRDRFVLSDDLDLNDIVIAQGKNPGKGGLNQPLDSVNNTLIIDKSDGHILASLTFAKSDAISERNFLKVCSTALDAAKNVMFNTQEGSGQLTGTQGHDKLIGSAGDDFLAPGDDTFKFRTAKSGEEFPFANDSPGSTRLNLDLKGGVLKVNGTYKNYDGAPLFSQGEKAIDPSAIILNGAGAQTLIDGFLKVPQDVEANPISGTHLHFSPAGDVRGNFADATVVRYFTNTPTSAKAGTISGEFELTPQEQAALLGGNFYVNAHTNVDVDGDGKGGFPTGENRINLNKNVVRFV
jgi:CHRD domain/RTX calcium-binding nonapeptide repeat (4 copies)